MVDNQIKNAFEDFVRTSSDSPDSGKGVSYRRALDLLNQWFAVDHPTWAVDDVWALPNAASAMALYEHVKDEQAHFINGHTGVFAHVHECTGYLTKRFCSAALKVFAEFLAQ